MSKIEEFYSINYFEKINEDHVFACNQEVREWCMKNRSYWIIDLISAYTTSKPLIETSMFVRWDLKIEDLRGWLVADDCYDNVLLRRRITYVPMEDMQATFLRRGNFLVMAED